MEGAFVVFVRTSSVARIPVYAHLRTLGITLAIVHPAPLAKDFEGLFDYWLNCDTDKLAVLESALDTFLLQHELPTPDAIVSLDEYGVYPASVLARNRGLRCVPLPPEGIQQNNLKSQFRKMCYAHGINAPNMTVLQPLCSIFNESSGAIGSQPQHLNEMEAATAEAFTSNVAAQLSGFSFPVVLKPSPGAGSLLVKLCKSIEEVCAHALVMWYRFQGHPDIRHFLCLTSRPDTPCHAEEPIVAEQPLAYKSVEASATTVAVRASLPAPMDVHEAMEVLVEEYISGSEVDLDCVVENGEVVFCSISDNFATTPPYFAEVGGLCPSRLTRDEQAALLDLLRAYTAVFGDTLHGVLHVEAIYDHARRRPYIIEVNCRMGSAETHAMVHATHRGFHLGEALVRCALGLPVCEQLARHYPDCFHFSTVPRVNCATHSSSLSGFSSSSSFIVSPLCDAVRNGAGVSGVVQPDELGGTACGIFPVDAVCASVNIYPDREGRLRHVSPPPMSDRALVACSVSAEPGDLVAPPPGRFYLLCWMVAIANCPGEAMKEIQRLSSEFVQEVDTTH